ncbi:WD40 repeat domain-containing protein [Undibacterium sp. Ji83W]|uniref:WD40 repeat domain-containing protein n=1 Tax=Undibacterium sp. Ji83W TaxID=3413043 RepID=UPI003BF278AE
MIDVEEIKSSLNAVFGAMYGQELDWIVIDNSVEILIRPVPEPLLLALCDGHISLENLIKVVPRFILQIVVADIQVWMNDYDNGGTRGKITSEVQGPDPSAPDYNYLHRLEFIRCLERHGIVRIEHALFNGVHESKIFIVGGTPVFTNTEIREKIYLGQEVGFRLFRETLLRQGVISGWGWGSSFVYVEEFANKMRHVVPYQALQLESYASEEAIRKRNAFDPAALTHGHLAPVTYIRFLSDGKYAVSASEDKMLRLWDVMSGRCVRVFHGHTRIISGLAICDNDRLLVSTGDLTIRIWDVDTGTCLRVISTGHQEWIRHISADAEGQYAISYGDERTFRLWDLATGECLHVSQVQEKPTQGIILDVAKQRFISLDGDFFEDLTLSIWHTKDLTFARKIIVKDVLVCEILGQTERNLICFNKYNGDYQVDLWNIDNEQRETIFSDMPKGRFGTRTPLAVNKGLIAISVNDTQNIEIWDGKKNQRLHVLIGHREEINCADFSADGNYLLTGAKDRTLRLWDMKSGECLREFANIH